MSVFHFMPLRARSLSIDVSSASFAVVAAFVCLFLCAPRSLSASDGGHPAILIVHSYHEGMEWTDGISAGLKEGLSDKAELIIHYLDVKRFPPAPRRAHLEAGLIEVIARSRPRLIVAVDDYAYDFMLQLRSRTAADTPIVFAGVNHWKGPHPANVTGVMESADLEGTLALACALHPQATRIVVVNDTTETGLSNRAALDAILQKFATRKFLFVGAGSFRETEQALAALHPVDDVVLLLSWNLDDTGKARSYPEAIARARALSPAPIYGVWSFYFGHGIVGGQLLDGRLHGLEAAGLATQLLAGVPVSGVQIVTRPKSTLLLDARELQRFQIPEERLPLKAEVRYRESSLWQRYRNTLLIIIVVVTLQAVTIFWLSVTIMRRRKAERRLRESEENLRMTLHSIQDAVITADTEERVRSMNPVAVQLTGWSLNEAEGRQVRDVFDLAKRGSGEHTARPTATALETGSVVRSLAVEQLRAKDGTSKPVSYSAAPIQDGRGLTTGVVLAFRDISHFLKLEEQLRQSQKIESLGLLAGGIAHDFNNILMAINGNLELLSDPSMPKDDAAECLREVGKAARRATALTQQLLAFGRRQKLAPKQVDMAELTAGILKMVKRLIGVDIAMSFDAPLGKYWVNVDGSQIEQVVLNLCINARDAMPGGGKLGLSLTHCSFTEEDMTLASWIRPGRFVQLAVSDTGKGMSSEILQRIFEPFFTTKGTGRGTGLGLAVVQGIIHQHKGLINVYSEEGSGSVFRVYLPAIEAPDAKGGAEAAAAAAKAAADLQVRIAKHKGAHVLLAEDDASARMAIAAILRRAGFRVLPVSDGEAACQACASQGTAIDAVVLDVMMPRMGGPEAARCIAERHPSMPIILCSGHPSSGELHQQWHWLQKPYTSGELLELIDKSLEKRAATTTGNAAQ